MVVRGGYESQWRGGSWFVIVFYGMFRQKTRWVHDAGCQCVYVQYKAVHDTVGTRRVISLNKYCYNDVAIMNS